MISARRADGSGVAGPALATLALFVPLVALAVERDLRLAPPEVTFTTSGVLRNDDLPLLTLRLDRDELPEFVGGGGTHRGTPLRQGGVNVRMRSPAFITGGAAAKGDLDGDGDLDLVLAEPCALATDPDLQNCCAGRVMVFWAPRTLPDWPREFLGDHLGDWTLIGNCETSYLGTRLAVADFNGDGVDDLVAGGVPGFNGTIMTGTCIYGIAGPLAPDAIVDLLDTPADFEICGGSGFGESLAAGDFDGDTVDDIAISGGDGIRIFRGQRLVGNVDWATPDTLIVLPTGSRGVPLSTNLPLLAHDVDGDGRHDLLIGLAGGDGEVELILGRTPLPASLDLNVTAADLAVLGGPGMNLGASIQAGAWTATGLPDLVAGAPGSDGPGGSRVDAGAVVVMDGLATLRGVVDLAVTSPAGLIHGVDPGDRLGDGVAGRGLLLDDASGDGVPDIAAWSPGARGVANYAASPVGEVSIVYGGVLGPIDLHHSMGSPAALSLLASGVASPWDGAAGLLGDGALHFFRLEEPSGVELAIFVGKQDRDRTVRISWFDGRPNAVAVDPLLSRVDLVASCVAPVATSGATVRVTPRDATGEALGTGLSLGPSTPDLWLPGIPTGGFRDLGNGTYELEVSSTTPGVSTIEVDAGGVALVDTATLNYSLGAPTVTVLATPSGGTGSVAVTLSASITSGTPPYSYSWDVDGDGQADSSEESPRHVYEVGSWRAVVTVTDGGGCSVRGSGGILVRP